VDIEKLKESTFWKIHNNTVYLKGLIHTQIGRLSADLENQYSNDFKNLNIQITNNTESHSSMIAKLEDKLQSQIKMNYDDLQLKLTTIHSQIQMHLKELEKKLFSQIKNIQIQNNHLQKKQ